MIFQIKHVVWNTVWFDLWKSTHGMIIYGMVINDQNTMNYNTTKRNKKMRNSYGKTNSAF